MKLYRWFLLCGLALLFALALSGCCLKHDAEVVPAVAAGCTASGLTEGSKCSNCDEVLVPQEVIPATGHTEVTVSVQAATCTEDGRSAGVKCGNCDAVIKGMNVIPARHDEVKIAGYAATCLARGLSDGYYCETCDAVLETQRVVERVPHQMENGLCSMCGYNGEAHRDLVAYINEFSYAYLASCEKGEEMQAMYREVDSILSAFHTDATKDASVRSNVAGVVAVIDYASYGLDLDQAAQVWRAYRDDHPLYYWIHYGYNYNSTNMLFKTTSAYAKGSDRAVYNEMIYSGLEQLVAAAASARNTYDTALALYDAIVENCSYAYEQEGSTAENELWAHSILGYFEHGEFVCEGYAKLYQMLLTYYDVENYYVHGDGHVWNLAKMNDGYWYWFDATWDDTGNVQATHRYFCVNDTQPVNWRDPTESSNAFAGSASFLDGHVPYVPTLPGDDGVLDSDALVLPARPDTVFDREDTLEMREQFTCDGFVYMRLGYDTVQLIGAENADHVIVPKTVTYNGMTYTVAAIGAVDDDGMLDLADYVIVEADTVTLPLGIVIRGRALSSPWLGEIVYY